jgi:hypothetical protein
MVEVVDGTEPNRLNIITIMITLFQPVVAYLNFPLLFNLKA